MVAMSLEETAWRAICERDESYIGQFYYGVVTTGIYCRPSCKSRRPKRENVRIFANQNEAETSGFRPCKRCRPNQSSEDDTLLTQACRLLEDGGESGDTVGKIAQACGISESRLRRLFKLKLDTTPYAYAQSHRAQRFKDLVQSGESVGMATYGAGYGSSSRLYEYSDTLLGMTPATYQRRGSGETIVYKLCSTDLGFLLVAGTGKGLCFVRFGDARNDLERELFDEFSQAQLVKADDALSAWTDALLAYLKGRSSWPDLPIDIRTTAFRARVYEALRKIPEGVTATYGEIAEAIGAPRAHRAVATACAQNPVPLAVPCHRVLPKTGGAGKYRFGTQRKQKLLALEDATRSRAG